MHDASAAEAFLRQWAGENNPSPATLARYRRWVFRWLTFLSLKSQPWQVATRDDALAWKLELVAADRHHADALRHALVAARTFYEWAIERGLYAGPNPFAKVRAPHTHRTAKLAPTPDQVARLLDQSWPADFRSLRARAVLAVCYGCGLRRSEARMLDLSDVDLDQGLVAVRYGKAGSNDVMPMLPYVAFCVRQYLQVRPLVRPRTPALFVGRRGGRIDPSVLGDDVAWAAKQAGIGRHLTPHDLRRGAATHLLQGGANIREVQMFLRHRQITSTQWYLGLSGQHLRLAVQRFHPLASWRPLPDTRPAPAGPSEPSAIPPPAPTPVRRPAPPSDVPCPSPPSPGPTDPASVLADLLRQVAAQLSVR